MNELYDVQNNMAFDALFPSDPISRSDIITIKHGWKQNNHFDLAELFIKHNIFIKRLKTDKNGCEAGLYIWNITENIWEYSNNKSDIFGIIVKTFKHLIRCCRKQNALTSKEANLLKSKYQNAKIIGAIDRFLSIRGNIDFEQELNAINNVLPISNNKKINLKTKEITNRGINDYFTYYLNVQYLPDLQDKDNKFYQFNKSLWNCDDEFEYWCNLNGKFLCSDEHDNLIICWEHPIGGGGKTIWLNCIHSIFNKFVTKLNINIFKTGGRNNSSFELCKLYGRTLAYCDENTKNTNELNSKKQTIDLALVLDISGGGMRGDVDKYKRVTASEAQKCTVTLLFVGNTGYFDAQTRMSALTRRLVMFTTEPYFRDFGDPDYNASDPNCRPKIPNLETSLLEKPDHIFTWFVNCAHKFLNNRLDLHSNQPERFKKYCQSIIDNNHATFDKVGAKVNTYLTKFIEEECENVEYIMSAKEFIDVFKKHVQDTYQKNIQISQQQLKISSHKKLLEFYLLKHNLHYYLALITAYEQ